MGDVQAFADLPAGLTGNHTLQGLFLLMFRPMTKLDAFGLAALRPSFARFTMCWPLAAPPNWKIVATLAVMIQWPHLHAAGLGGTAGAWLLLLGFQFYLGGIG